MSNNASLSSAPAIAGLTTEMAKIPKSDAAVVWNATAQTTIQTKAAAAITAFAPPTKVEMDAAHALLATPAQVNAEALAAVTAFDTATETATVTAHNNIYADLVKVPKSDGAVSWNAVALAAIKTEAENALDTAIPGVPTADSVNEIIKGLGLVNYLGPTGYSLSNVIILSNDTERTGKELVYTMKKEILCPMNATIRVNFEIKNNNLGVSTWGRIYKNGVAHGVARCTPLDVYKVYSEDLAFVAGDLIQIYVYTDNVANPWFLKNFRILGGWAHNFENTLE